MNYLQFMINHAKATNQIILCSKNCVSIAPIVQTVKLPNSEKWSFHFWYGINSDFPLCCIFWFLYLPFWYLEETYIGGIPGLISKEHNNGNSRKMCPQCLMVGFNK